MGKDNASADVARKLQVQGVRHDRELEEVGVELRNAADVRKQASMVQVH
jgi:hypothetical protein